MNIMSKILVTGGAGFIGSHLVDKLLSMNEKVIVLDNLSSGDMKNIKHNEGNPNFEVVVGDLLKPEDIEKCLNDVEKVYHLAANPDVKIGAEDSRVHFDQNIVATYNLLEAMRKKGIKNIIFTSTSAVYGDATQIPTKEDYGPLIPISLYAASKLAAEALISSYCYTFDMKSVLLRFANVIGERSGHGVIFDFIKKLKQNPKELEILGDGTQSKSYLYIDDCIDGMIFSEKNAKNRVEIFNLGSEDRITVKEIADLVVKGLGLENIEYKFTGGVDGGRGWKGDVKYMLLSIDKIKQLGWKPKYNSKESVEKTIEILKKLF